MKKIVILCFTLALVTKAKTQDLEIDLLNKSKAASLSTEKDTITILQQKDADNIAIVKFKMLNTTIDINATLNDNSTNTAQIGTDYSYVNLTLPSNLGFTEDNNRENVIKIAVAKGENVAAAELYAELDVKWPSLTQKDKILHKVVVIKILKKEQTKESKIEIPTVGRKPDDYNYFKAEIIQYSDISGIKNDKPNGLLQFQGIIKIPINHNKTTTASGWFHQSFRAVLLDVLINRIDKSKEEIDYNYTTFLYENDKAKKSSHPWLATTDLCRFSNLHVGLRLVPLTIGKKDFRIQLQTGVKLLKSLPFAADTIRSGVDSGKVKSDFRSVYSYAKYIELFFKYYNSFNKVNLSLNTGLMWVKLLDSYYDQIDIYQQDPFQKTIALAPVNSHRKSPPLWFASLRFGKAIGKEATVSTFLRVNYTLQTGTYFKPLSNIIDGRPVAFEEKRFYNNFFQVHIGTTFDLDNIFSQKKDEKKKDDGPISNSGIN